MNYQLTSSEVNTHITSYSHIISEYLGSLLAGNIHEYSSNKLSAIVNVREYSGNKVIS